MIEKNKNKKVIIVSIISMLILIVGISYAWVEFTYNNTDISFAINNIIFNYTAGPDVSATNMMPVTYKEEGIVKDITVLSITSQSTKFNLYLKINSIDTELTQDETFKYTVCKGDVEISTGNFYNKESGDEVTILENHIVPFYESGETLTYTLYIWIDGGLGDNNPNILNKFFSFTLYGTGEGAGKYASFPVATELVSYLSTNDDGTNNLATSGGVYAVSHTATGNQTYDTIDYRYYGSSPENYVYFNCADNDGTYDYGHGDYNYANNCELWRIVGSFEVETPIYDGETFTGDYRKEYRLKLIKNASIGIYSWDTTASEINSGYGYNEWSQADLMKLLNPGYETNQDLDSSGNTITLNNSLYYNGGSGDCYNGQNNATTTCTFPGLSTTAKNMIDETKYYTAGYSSSSATSSSWYNYERGTSTGTAVPGLTRYTSYNARVGLMYPSDYGYAAGSTCASWTNLTSYNSTCNSYDWFYGHYNGWTLSPDSNNSSAGWGPDYSSILTNYYSYAALSVYPVLYLTSDVYIKSGKGVINNAFVLS